MPALVIYPREGESSFLGLPDAEMIIGRSRDCSLVLMTKFCSLRHAAIYPIEGGYAIRDLGSQYGTYVNGRRIEDETRLSLQDEILVGDTRMFLVPGEGRRPSPPDTRWTPRRLDLRAGTAVALVDDRAFVLGLDGLYRDAMKTLESSRLLQCARAVATRLNVKPGQFPIEGYYAETAKLREYFSLMQAFQGLSKAKKRRVKHLAEFQFLDKVARSCLYGRPEEDDDKLLPRALDPLALALKGCAPDWTVKRLVRTAYETALRDDDCSLVGLASRTQDAVVLTATRESTVLYADVICVGCTIEPEVRYEWAVHDSLAEAANRFIDTFNELGAGALPRAEAANARRFYKSYTENEFVGRCVRIGMTPDGKGHYHWAVAMIEPEPGVQDLEVDEFWSGDIWTTDKYRQAQGGPDRMRLFAKTGVPGSEGPTV